MNERYRELTRRKDEAFQEWFAATDPSVARNARARYNRAKKALAKEFPDSDCETCHMPRSYHVFGCPEIPRSKR